jgi:hypothetical protein
MKINFTAQLDELTRQAQLAILESLVNRKHIILFTTTGKEEFGEEWSLDIYDDVPDFPCYDKHDGIEYAAVKELKFEDDNVVITGILKRDSYPDTCTITLLELDAPSSCALADYLTAIGID